MTERKFQVEVVSRQRTVYHVDAVDGHEAERLAVQRWQSGEPSDLVGFESSHLEAVNVTEAGDDVRQRQDEELVLRFIRERERLLVQLGGNLLTASISDAISASQAAADLGWLRPGRGEANTPDAVRAAAALERLCAKKKLVCFERDRIRAGERGAIRLYCTAEYLEKLSEAMYDPRPSSVG
jgi:hypothetical protein